MKQKTVLLIIAMIAMILFVLPAVYSLFAGQHLFASRVGCLRCHNDVAEQLSANMSEPAFVAHKRAAGNVNYTTYLAIGGIDYDAANGVINTTDTGIWTWNITEKKWQSSDGKLLLVSLDEDGRGDITPDEMCFLCHKATLFGISATHTNTTARGCDDDRCHGNTNHQYNDPDLFPDTSSSVVHAGYLLSEGNVHVPFYASASKEESSHVDGSPFGQPGGNVAPNSSYISKGFWTCMGCHSHIGVNPVPVSTTHYLHDTPSATKQRYM